MLPPVDPHLRGTPLRGRRLRVMHLTGSRNRMLMTMRKTMPMQIRPGRGHIPARPARPGVAAA